MIGGHESLPTAFSLVPLQMAGAGRPIFVVHGILRDVVRHLRADRPVYGLSFGLAAQTINEGPGFPDRLENLAAQYLGELRLVQPLGPYSMIGYSFGGLVAFEMAQQLLAQGETVDFLGLIDSTVPTNWTNVTKFPLYRQILNLFQLPLREIALSVKIYYLRRLIRKLPWIKSIAVGEQPENQLFADRISLSFWTSYTPKPYSGKLTLFKAKWLSVRNRRLPFELAWSELTAGRLRVREVPGRHNSVTLGPNARVLAANLRACLNCDDRELGAS